MLMLSVLTFDIFKSKNEGRSWECSIVKVLIPIQQQVMKIFLDWKKKYIYIYKSFWSTFLDHYFCSKYADCLK